MGRVDVIHADPGETLLTDELIFESLWYGRASFVVDSPERAEMIIRYTAKRLGERRETRAGITQPVHIIWGMNGGFPEDLRDDMNLLSTLTGVAFIEKDGEGA